MIHPRYPRCDGRLLFSMARASRSMAAAMASSACTSAASTFLAPTVSAVSSWVLADSMFIGGILPGDPGSAGRGQSTTHRGAAAGCRRSDATLIE